MILVLVVGQEWGYVKGTHVCFLLRRGTVLSIQNW